MQQQSKSLINATSNFAFALQTELQKCDEDFRVLVPYMEKFSSINLDSTSLDFLFTLVNDSLINAKELKVKNSSYLNIRSNSFRKFFSSNQALVLRYAQLPNGKTFYYGRIITSELLNRIGEKINAEIALVVNDSPVEVSKPDQNQVRLLSVVNAVRALKYKNNFDLYSEELDDADFVSSIYSPRFIFFPELKVNFIVFQAFREGVEFRYSLQIVMLLIVLAGSAITFIVVFVSTAKLRRQIGFLSKGAEETGKGNLEHRVPVITKDEIGHFSETFNKMLDELVRNKKAEKEYSEFIALINQNPTLKEISDAALSKILKSTHITFGALYIVEKEKLRPISSYGISRSSAQLTDSDFYTEAIKKKESKEFSFHDNYPEIKTGIATVKIKYLVIYPVVYNKETIAVLELASESVPEPSIEKYINTIHEQLAVGLINAKSFEQLENLVIELRDLNNEYQKQNKQIIEQNEELKLLHGQLREKAEELEKQRGKAIELTKVKSDFLASMSHELRTPLISILGLTELLIKDTDVNLKVKDRLNIVNRNGKKLLGLINNILEFSKFESGRIDVKKETFILNDLIEEIQPNVLQIAADKKLNLIFDLPVKKTILLNTDKEKLEQVLQNLIVNAIKFTENGFVKLKVSVFDSAHLEVEVVDSGIGISEEFQAEIFNEFKQVDGSTSRKYGGTGLGLAICKKYVNLLGGDLSVKSEIEKGSSFYFTLKEVVLDLIDVEEHRFLTVETQSEDEITEKKPVLIITDSEATQKLVGDYLASYNVRYDWAVSCDEADNLISQKEFSAIILNPFCETFRLIAETKKNKLNNTAQIILALIIEEMKYGWEPNIYDFLTVPIYTQSLNHLLDKIEKKIKGRINRVAIVTGDAGFEHKVGTELKNYSSNLIIDYSKNHEELISISMNSTPDLIMVDVDSLKENSLEICYAASLSRALRNCPIIFILSREFSVEKNREFVEKFKEISIRVKQHPLDILKVLRDRLNLEQSVNKKKIMLIEETLEDAEDAGTISKKKNNGKPTVLIVDDDEDALFTVGEYVKALDCDAIFAHNGMECLLMLNHVVPDLILLDIMMPQMDGFETIKRIRNDNRFSKLPVIALTAYAMLDNKNVIEKNGFNDLVTKPINSQSLSAKITKYLGRA
jgi:signal transduction histidine kinase/CheY-like chemotaxis protein/HAMP domain-containing protein